MNFRLIATSCCALILLTACDALFGGAPPVAPAEDVILEEAMQGDELTDAEEDAEDTIADDDGHMMDDMDGMMMRTAALSEMGCEELKALSAVEKAQIMDEIAHNMDIGALDFLLGETCAFAGEAVRVADVSDDDLKLNPEDDEVLYFLPETNQFFVTCVSMNTVAYLLERRTEEEPLAYFTEHQEEFRVAATNMKKMMENMIHNEMDDMMHEDDEEDTDAAAGVGAYVDAYDDASIAESAIASGEKVAVFYYASWCGYCQAKHAALNTLYEDGEYYSVSMYRVNYDTRDDYELLKGVVSAQDTIVVFEDGKPVEVISGATEEDLVRILSEA